MALALCTMSGAALVACNEGTKPGETSVERGGIKDPDPGEMVGGDDATRYSDTTDLEEKYYGERADTTVIGEGAYDGKGDGKERDDY